MSAITDDQGNTLKCESCDESVWKHAMRGTFFYCDPKRMDKRGMSPTFGAAAAVEVRSMLGINVTNAMRDKVRKEKR